MKYEEIELTDNEEQHRFELWVNDKPSFVDYKRKGDTLSLLHTEVPQELEGRGIAAALVEKIFRRLEENQLKLVPLCAYVNSYLKRHPEWNRLVGKNEE